MGFAEGAKEAEEAKDIEAFFDHDRSSRGFLERFERML